MAANSPRRIYLPLSELGECTVCKQKATKWCGACAEATYCSLKCQRAHWSKHKKDCGETERIDLKSFYPFIACLVDENHFDPLLPLHPALTHRIMNHPNPENRTWPHPQGPNVVVLDEPIGLDELCSEKWWPSSETPTIRDKLFARIKREGNVLPILTAVCLALLAEMYTTTSGSTARGASGKGSARLRLRHKTSPIADFGICSGSIDVDTRDLLAYSFNPKFPASFLEGQHPQKHYWLYFTTISGEDFILDCSLFTMNMCDVIRTELYPPHYGSDLHNNTPLAPCYFSDSNDSVYTYEEVERYSALHDPSLRRIVAQDPFDELGESEFLILEEFMENVSGCPLPTEDRSTILEFTKRVAIHNSTSLHALLVNRGYSKFPLKPEHLHQGDSDSDESDVEEAEEEAEEVIMSYYGAVGGKVVSLDEAYDCLMGYKPFPF